MINMIILLLMGSRPQASRPAIQNAQATLPRAPGPGSLGKMSVTLSCRKDFCIGAKQQSTQTEPVIGENWPGRVIPEP